MISTINLKRSIAGASVLSVIVVELHHGKKLCQIIMLKVDKGLEINFHCTIVPLSLAVSLWVKSN